MRMQMGGSTVGKVQDAAKGISKPDFLIMIASEDNSFEKQVKELEQMFPGIPSIACVGQAYYGTNIVEKGVMIVAMEGVAAVANVLTDVSTMPVKKIKNLEADFRRINPTNGNTVCIDFCSSNDECVLATINSLLRTKNISLTGGTAWGRVAANGTVYEDACAYALVQNKAGKIKVYRENIYLSTEASYIVTKADPSKNLLMELDGKSAVDVYKNQVHVSSAHLEEQTFQNPFGRQIGDEVFIVSLKEMIDNKSFSCYRKVNQMDVLNIMQLGDYQQIVLDTISSIRNDFRKVSGVFSVNCLFRYLLFSRNNYKDTYFKNMAQLGNHAGLIGLGEHYNAQHTNQTLSCVVFE